MVWGASGPNTGGGPGGSSGGIQTTIPIPDYQKPINMSAVGGSTTHFNVPDVAAAASSILDVVTRTNGVQTYYSVVGTSCAAPLWAAFAALANEQAASEGKPYVGFINPALYSIARSQLYRFLLPRTSSAAITRGATAPASTRLYTGYDLCTGWGSPNGQSLINALVGLSGPVFVDFNYTGPASSNGSYDGPGKLRLSLQNPDRGSQRGHRRGNPCIIKTAGASSETMTITKPMTIIASDGAATIGQ